MGDFHTLSNRAEALPLVSVNKTIVKKRKLSSVMMKIERQSMKIMTNKNEEDVKVGVESLARVKEASSAQCAVFETLQPEVECSFLFLKVDMEGYCYSKSTTFKELKDLRAPETSYSLHQLGSLLLADASLTALVLWGVRSNTLAICIGKKTLKTL